MERGGRSPDDRVAAREARARARLEPEEEAPPADLESMNRYGGGMDVYTRRRLIAGLAVLALIVVLFLVLGGC